MSNYSCFSRLSSLGKLKLTCAFNNFFLHHRSLCSTTCSGQRCLVSVLSLLERDKYTRFPGITRLSCRLSSTSSTSSIAADVLKDLSGDKKCHCEETNQLAAEVDKGLQELEELANTEVRRAATVHVAKYNPEVKSYSDINVVDDDRQVTTFKLPRSGNKIFELFGTPDPKQPVSQVRCPGCGALLHCKDPGIPGYLSSQAYLAIPKSHLKDCLCQRCQLLNMKQIALDLTVPLDKFNPVIREVRRRSALIILLVDMTDLSNGFHKKFWYVTGNQRPIYIVGNKVDLLPEDSRGYLDRAMEALVETARENGFTEENVHHFSLISGKTGYGVEDLITKMLTEWRRQGHVYIMGSANCGKSTLFNTLLASDFCNSSAKEVIHRATTSTWPGTTLNLLKFPIVNPRTSNLYEREVRLEKEMKKNREEERLDKTRKNVKPSLHDRLGSTFLTPKQMAIVDQSSENVGYLVPTYTHKSKNPGEEETTDELSQSPGHDGAVEYLGVKPLPYTPSLLKYWCYDTPGLINPDQIINLLNQSELLASVPKKRITPRTYFIKVGQVMFVSGLSRIDYMQGDGPIRLTVCSSLSIPVHVLDGNEADAFYEKNIGTETLLLPMGDSERLKAIPPLVGKEFEITGLGLEETAADIVLSSLGWVAVTSLLDSKVTLKAYTPGGHGCKLRTIPLLQNPMRMVGSRINGTSRYRTLSEQAGYEKRLKTIQNMDRYGRKKFNNR